MLIYCFCCLLQGLFFVLPCTDTYTKVDLRTVSFDVPPQEVGYAQTWQKHRFLGKSFDFLVFIVIFKFLKFSQGF